MAVPETTVNEHDHAMPRKRGPTCPGDPGGAAGIADPIGEQLAEPATQTTLSFDRTRDISHDRRSGDGGPSHQPTEPARTQPLTLAPIARNKACAIMGHTLLPIILKECQIVEWKRKPSGNPCSLAASLTVITRGSSGWMGLTD